MAKKRGARVFGTVSTDEKAAIARAAGADEIIFYTRTDFAAEVKQLTHGQGVNVVYDSVGKDTFDQSLNSLKVRGTMILFGQSSGAVPPFSPQVLNAKGGLFLTRPSLVHYTQTRDELEWRMSDIFGWISSGTLTVRVDRLFSLADTAQAHAYIEGRQTKGKVLLVP
jgi:NADPH2:quinone reductase